VFDKFPKYHMNVLLGDFSAKVGRTFPNQQIGNESLHKISNDDRLCTTKNLSKVQCYHIATFINLLGHLLQE
jgi:hypothetical protein